LHRWLVLFFKVVNPLLLLLLPASTPPLLPAVLPLQLLPPVLPLLPTVSLVQVTWLPGMCGVNASSAGLRTAASPAAATVEVFRTDR
jgi:hypothetical protein